MAETMTFILEGRDRLSRVLDKAGDSAKRADKYLAAFGASIPAAASIAPLVGAVGGATIAVAAFGLAVGGQIGPLSDASQAQKKHKEAVEESGAASAAAVKAELEYHRTLVKMPPATRQAAAALSAFKEEYREYSDGLAGDTMPVVTKSLGVFGALLPRTKGLVKGTSGELDRLMDIAGGGMASPGFDRFMGKVEKFAVGSLRQSIDGIVHLSRVASGSKIGDSVSEFMDFARAQGPLVKDTLTQVAVAVAHVVEATSGLGVGFLQVANAAARMVASLPVGFITVLLQMAVAIRAAALASRLIQLAAGAFVIARAAILRMATAAIGASTAVGTLTTMFMALSAKARFALAATGIGLVVLGLIKLSSIGKQAPPDVDRLTTSLGELARTGKVSGEAARAYGKDLSGLGDSLRTLSRPSNLDKTQQFLTGLVGMDSTPVKEAKQDFDAIDKSLANLVKGGKGDVAAAALDRVIAGLKKQGYTADEVTKQLGDYKSALADQQFEQELAAQSMGLFGKQAQQTQQALAAQKLSADALRQSIQALNEVNRAGLGGMIGFEASIDAAAKAARENAGVLNMHGGKLDLAGEKSRAAATALNDLAAKTDEATAAARESGASWGTVNGIYTKGRDALIKSAQAMGLTKAEATSLANQILKTPDKTAKLKGNMEDLEAKLKAAKTKLARVPDSRKAKVRAEISDLNAKIAEARRKLDNLDGKTATTYVVTRFETKGTGAKVAPAKRDYATGGPIGFPGGGPIKGPGTGTSDSIPIMASTGEYMINARSTSKYWSLIEAINADTLGGGLGGAGTAVARGLVGGMTGSAGGVYAGARRMAAEVTAGIRAELEISSPSKKTAALAKDVGAGFIKGLTSSRDKIRSVANDLAGDIRTAFSGKKETALLRMVDQQTKKLVSLAGKRDQIAAKIAEAKGFRDTVMNSARSGATLGNLGLDVVTAGGIKSAMAGKLSKIRRFTAYIKKLAARGLHKTLLRQVLDMGPEEGYTYAAALAEADKATLTSINKTQFGLDTASRTLGEIGADRLYDAGKNAGKGFLEGLKGQQKSIEDLMVKIAKGMQKALKAALGINSPARKLIPDGINTVRGIALGVVRGLPHLDDAMQAVAGRMSGVIAAPVSRLTARTGGAGARPVEIHIHVDGTVMDPVAVGRQIQTVLLEFKRGLGGAALGLA